MMEVFIAQSLSCRSPDWVKAVRDHIVSAASHTAHYIKENWGKILAFIVAWGAIVVLAGFLYGFSAVALPLTIGISCGLGAGTLLTMLARKKWEKLPSLWEWLNGHLDGLDKGTNNMICMMATTAILGLAALLPLPAGVLFGAVIANFAVIAIMRSSPHTAVLTPVSLAQDIEKLKRELDRKINELQNTAAILAANQAEGAH